MVMRMDTPGGEKGTIRCACGSLASYLVTNHKHSYLCDGCLVVERAAEEVEEAAKLLQREDCTVCKQCEVYADSYVSGFCSTLCRDKFFAEGKSH